MAFKHDALVRAWLDGKALQFLTTTGWKDVAMVDDPLTSMLPAFSANREYRIKPEPVIRKSRHFWYKDQDGKVSISVVFNEFDAETVKKWNGFIGWADAWQTFTLEEDK